jgi:Putative enzyme of poly-gamma-glutamate biosynthesis (capsule formation)
MISVLIAGDFCPQRRVSALFDKGDYVSVLGGIRASVMDADYRIVNFECPVSMGDEPPIIKRGPNLRCSEKGLEAIKWAGFDCVTLANNHFYDFGYDGVVNTLDACRKSHLDAVGGGVNLAEASAVLYKEVGDKTLAIINCCEHEYSVATVNTAGSNPLDPIQQYRTIVEARKSADYVLVIVHGGHEMWPLPSPRMVQTYQFFIDAGADAVVNHHQHCFSGYEVYKNKPIFYGLGNFCFDKPQLLYGPVGIWLLGKDSFVRYDFL